MIVPTATASTGTITSSSEDSGTSRFSARMIPPTHMIGADTISVSVITTSIWICWTSLVVRVISDGVPNWPTSRAEKSCTRWKTAGADVAADRHRGAGAVVHRADRPGDLGQRHGQHHGADAQDVPQCRP